MEVINWERLPLQVRSFGSPLFLSCRFQEREWLLGEDFVRKGIRLGGLLMLFCSHRSGAESRVELQMNNDDMSTFT